MDYLKIISDVKTGISAIKAAAADGKLTKDELIAIVEDFGTIVYDLWSVAKTMLTKAVS